MTTIQVILLVCLCATVINSKKLDTNEMRRKLSQSDQLENIVKDLQKKNLLSKGSMINGNYNLAHIVRALMKYDEISEVNRKYKRSGGPDDSVKDFIAEITSGRVNLDDLKKKDEEEGDK